MLTEHGGFAIGDHVQLVATEDVQCAPTGIIKAFKVYPESDTAYARVADDHPWLGEDWMPLTLLVRM
jgi:hypothetical protein